MRNAFNQFTAWVAQYGGHWGNLAVAAVITTAVPIVVVYLLHPLRPNPPPQPPATKTPAFQSPSRPSQRAFERCRANLPLSELHRRRDVAFRSHNRCMDEYRQGSTIYFESEAKRHCAPLALQLDQADSALKSCDLLK